MPSSQFFETPRSISQCLELAYTPALLWDASEGEMIEEIMQRQAEISEHHMVVTFCTRRLQEIQDAIYPAEVEIMVAFNFDFMGNDMVEKITEKVAA